MKPRFVRTALFVTGGLLIWAADFLFIYVFSSVACARGHTHFSIAGMEIVRLASAITTLLAAGATVAMIVVAARASAQSRSRGPQMFLNKLARIVAMLALLAIAFVAVPGLLSYSC